MVDMCREEKNIRWKGAIEVMESKHCKLVLNAVFYWEPMEFFQKWCDMITLRFFQDGGIVCFTIGMPRLSMQQCLEIWLIVLSGLSCKLDVLSSASTSTDIMKP